MLSSKILNLQIFIYKKIKELLEMYLLNPY